MCKIINLTPDDVTVVNPETNEVISTFPKSDNPVRLAQFNKVIGKIKGITTTRTVFGESLNFPNYKKGTYLIVSRIIMTAFPEREDLLVPNGIVRNEDGVIIGCTSLAVS